MTVVNENMEWSITCDGATESATGVVLDAQLYDDDEIEVILKTIATGAEATLTKTSDYLVTGVPGATAVVKTVSNYTSASAIYVRRTAVLSQTDDIVTGDPFPSEVIETILDKDAMALQVINDKASRGLQVSKTSDLSNLSVVPVASQVFGMNADNDALIMYPTTASGDADLADLLSAAGFGTIIYPQEVQIGSTGIRVISGTGSPEGVHTAKVGSLFLRTDGGANTTLYKKETGTDNTGWVVDNISNSMTDQGGSSNLLCKVLEIGDWDMDTTTGDGVVAVTVTHGIADSKKIRSVDVMIRDDDNAGVDSLNSLTSNAGTAIAFEGGVYDISPTGIELVRLTGGLFDVVLYDSTSYNRGWIIIWYTE